MSQRLAKGHQRGSTLKLYQSKWQIFSLWCEGRRTDPLKATVSQVADFLLHMFEEENRGPSALQGFRSAINSVWAYQGRSLNNSYEITCLLKSFSVERPRTINKFPKWDLALILRTLNQAPYEPLSTASPLHLTRKAVFLLLLASAHRVSDINALDPQRTVVRPDAMILQLIPGFLPKAATAAEGAPRYSPIVIRRLKNYATDPENLTLCPVRALLAYERYASNLKEDCDHYFLSLTAPYQPVKKATISGWAVQLIKDSYTNATESDLRLSSVNAHEVRAIATSLAFQATHSLDHVMATAKWANHSTFTSYYLRDVSGIQGRIHTIGPCVVVSHMMH